MKNLTFLILILFSISSTFSCKKRKQSCEKRIVEYNAPIGCDGRTYSNPTNSEYVLPYRAGTTYTTGLTNCSSSYHSSEYPDRYAFDFDMPVGTPFYASRGGTVAYIENNQPSDGGGGGNFCVIDHDDITYGLYYHSPKNGFSVIAGQVVEQGDQLGITGKSGLAGYPHLHFIVVQNSYGWPYDAIPITFKNNAPGDVIMKSHTEYKACEY